MKAAVVHDHLGNTFTSLAKMCMQYGLSASTVKNRLRWNWSLKDALETPTGVRRKIAKV